MSILKPVKFIIHGLALWTTSKLNMKPTLMSTKNTRKCWKPKTTINFGLIPRNSLKTKKNKKKSWRQNDMPDL